MFKAQTRSMFAGVLGAALYPGTCPAETRLSTLPTSSGIVSRVRIAEDVISSIPLVMELTAQADAGSSDTAYGELVARALDANPNPGQLRNYLLLRRAIYDNLRGRHESSSENLLAATKGGTLRREDAVKIFRRLAWTSQKQNDLVAAYGYYKDAELLILGENTRMENNSTLAGILIELAKGEGKTPLEASDRPACWAKAGDLLGVILASPASSRRQLMLAGLMDAEIHYFAKEFATSRSKFEAYFAKWGGVVPKLTIQELDYYATAVVFGAEAALKSGMYTAAADECQVFLADSRLLNRGFQGKNNRLYATAVMSIANKHLGRTVSDPMLSVSQLDAGYFGNVVKSLETK